MSSEQLKNEVGRQKTDARMVGQSDIQTGVGRQETRPRSGGTVAAPDSQMLRG